MVNNSKLSWSERSRGTSNCKIKRRFSCTLGIQGIKQKSHTQMEFAIAKRLVVGTVIILFIFSVFLYSCVGPSDWTYELPNDYKIFRLNTVDICIYNNNSIVVEEYITCFAYNERFICARRLVLDDDKQYFHDDIMALDFDQAVYCIVDTQTNDVYDLLTKENYEYLCTELKIENLCEWINTSPKPDGAR